MELSKNSMRALFLVALIAMSSYATGRDIGTMDDTIVTKCSEIKECSIHSCTDRCNELGWDPHRCYCSDSRHCCTDFHYNGTALTPHS
ncbi:hypothetical protein BRADI_1g78255v3 [Brachypodium distachyon]|uniref:Knottin scorpion toxin-like domain-containing protein n=1 Tax=Brachypodium distachyon TaxID=15368 RepID=A0A0Q3K2N3_BRADI|nr:hypothetical protein BRADI_1g78255v3 [Brachypodium distachyon]